MKTDGVFHSYNPDPAVYGMVHEFTVTDAKSHEVEPTATLSLNMSSTGGITMSAAPWRGGVDLEGLKRWMDWSRPGGLQTPAPVEFLGGLNEMPAGSTGYFSANLEPGTYAWIAEVPGARAKGMLQTFTVGAASD